MQATTASRDAISIRGPDGRRFAILRVADGDRLPSSFLITLDQLFRFDLIPVIDQLVKVFGADRRACIDKAKTSTTNLAAVFAGYVCDRKK